MGKPWIQTVSGGAVDLLDPHASQIEPRDLIHGVAHLCRFTGHTRDFYSVAEHSVQAWMWAGRLGLPVEVQRQALAHDLHEALTGDVATPIKRAVGPAWTLFETRIESAVRTRLGLPATLHPDVKLIDLSLLLLERDQLLADPPRSWGFEDFVPLPRAPAKPLDCYAPFAAEFHLESAMRAAGLL